MGSLIQSYLGLIILLLILYGSLILLRRYQSRRAFRDNSFLYEQLEVRFTDSGVDFIRPNSSSHLDWSIFQSVIDTNKFLLLVWGKNIYSIIPRRALSPNQIPTVVEMLKYHVTNYEARN